MHQDRKFCIGLGSNHPIILCRIRWSGHLGHNRSVGARWRSQEILFSCQSHQLLLKSLVAQGMIASLCSKVLCRFQNRAAGGDHEIGGNDERRSIQARDAVNHTLFALVHLFFDKLAIICSRPGPWRRFPCIRFRAPGRPFWFRSIPHWAPPCSRRHRCPVPEDCRVSRHSVRFPNIFWE